MSDSIWCLKNSPSFFSKGGLFPVLDVYDADEDEADAKLLPGAEESSDSNHM